MSKVKQSRKDLLLLLDESLGFLKQSAASFDSGAHGEAKRLAVTMRVLLHDAGRSQSLLRQLGYKDSTGYLDTASEFRPGNLLGHFGLVVLRAGGGEGSFYAPLAESEQIPGRPNKYVFFPDWWGKVVIKDSNNVTFNRRELVLALANKDGGAHVDPELDEPYANLSRNNSFGWTYTSGTDTSPVSGIELHSVRQIAYELVTSIERKLAKN